MYNVVLNRKEFKRETKETQFCVVGGGMAGLCAALAAARNGIRTLLVQDRAVLGGNASSEVRMWVCGAHGKDAKEGGILEEILLRNLYYNSELKYTIWDDVLYGMCREEPLLEVIFNCSINEVSTEKRAITSIQGWHLTRQCWIDIKADYFADCSGDSVLSVCGAQMRWGRESRYEFDEGHAPVEADNKTMGNSILIQLREVETHKPFIAPAWAKKLSEEELTNRGLQTNRHNNFWWLEIGGLMDTIDDSDIIRDENMAIAYGVWDFIKNHPDGRGHEWELEWIGSLPGKRENLRYVGDLLLNQNHIEAEGHFDDIVCHGGWSMDDHHPEAINYRGKPTIFHPAPSPYGIPYRALYSKDMDNLFCAGRNISATHMAMSSTRVMGTTSVMGQAVGTAAAIAINDHLSTRDVYTHALDKLQERLLDQDQYIPWSIRPLAINSDAGELSSSNAKQDLGPLSNGVERSLAEVENFVTFSAEDRLSWTFKKAQAVGSLRLVCDSDFDRSKRMACSYPSEGNAVSMPKGLLRHARVEVQSEKGEWSTHSEIKDNFKRLIHVSINKSVKAVCIVFDEAWEGITHIFSFDLV
jgi:hypothetical protein